MASQSAAIIEARWSRVLQTEVDNIRKPGLRLSTSAVFPPKAVNIFKRSQTCIVCCHPVASSMLHAALSSLQSADQVNGEMLAKVLGEKASCVSNSADVCYLGNTDPVVRTSGHMRELTSRDRNAFLQLEQACTARELAAAHVEFDQSYLVGCFHDDVLASVAGYKLIDNIIADICVLTHPDFRRKGLKYGLSASSMATVHALGMNYVPQWWVYVSNTGSVRLADLLGYTAYAKIQGLGLA